MAADSSQAWVRSYFLTQRKAEDAKDAKKKEAFPNRNKVKHFF